MDWNGSNLINNQKIVSMKSCHIYRGLKWPIYFWGPIGSDVSKWIKMDQTWSNWNSDEIIIDIYHEIFNFIFFYQIESDVSKMDQNGSNLIKLDFWWNNHWNISSDFQFYLSFDQIESDLSKIVNIIKFAIFINFISFSFLSLQSFRLHLISFVIFISSIIMFCFFI